MSHEIGQHDKQQGIAMAWHGLTEVLETIVLAACFLAGWDVRKRPLYRPVAVESVQSRLESARNTLAEMETEGESDEAEISAQRTLIANLETTVATGFESTSACEVVCTDNESVIIGKPVDCDSYSLLTNSGFLAIVQSAFERISGAIVASVGSVCNRARIFVTLQLPKLPSFVAADREFRPYLNFLSSHDKSAPFIVNLSTVCTVCNNTFSMNLQDSENKSFRVEVRHTKNMASMLADVPEMIEAFYATAHKFQTVLNHLGEIPVSGQDARNFFTGFLFEKDEAAEIDTISTRRLNQIDRLTILFVSGKGNNGKNLADVFSAVTDFYSHESVNSKGNNVQGQIESSEFGSGAAMKSLAFVILQDDKRISELIAKGATILANHETAEKAKVAS